MSVVTQASQTSLCAGSVIKEEVFMVGLIHVEGTL